MYVYTCVCAVYSRRCACRLSTTIRVGAAAAQQQRLLRLGGGGVSVSRNPTNDADRVRRAWRNADCRPTGRCSARGRARPNSNESPTTLAAAVTSSPLSPRREDAATATVGIRNSDAVGGGGCRGLSKTEPRAGEGYGVNREGELSAPRPNGRPTATAEQRPSHCTRPPPRPCRSRAGKKALAPPPPPHCIILYARLRRRRRPFIDSVFTRHTGHSPARACVRLSTTRKNLVPRTHTHTRPCTHEYAHHLTTTIRILLHCVNNNILLCTISRMCVVCVCVYRPSVHLYCVQCRIRRNLSRKKQNKTSPN